MRNSSLKRSGMAHVNEGSHSFTCHPQSPHTHLSTSGMNHNCQCLYPQLQSRASPHFGRYSFLANVNSLSRSLYAIARPSVVCNVHAPYSGGSNFLHYFYGIRYLGYPLTSTENFTEIVPGNPSARGVKHKRGSQV